jgi:hypothetical protein
MSSLFVNHMDALEVKRLGENGAAELSSSSDPRVDLFFALVRSLPADRLNSLIGSALADSTVPAEALAADLIVIAFQTRDCRGGKGEKALFVDMFLELACRFPATMQALLALVPQYGCWRDLFCIAKRAGELVALVPLSQAALVVAADQLRVDAAALAAAEATGEKPRNISLAAKWAPREACKSFPGQAKRLAKLLFPEMADSRAQYRKLLAGLNRGLSTVEVLMCAQQWDAIEPTAVPSCCLMKARKALLNERVKGPVTPEHAETGNRHPDDGARVGCRKRVRAALVAQGTKKLKGKQLHPHEIVQKLMGGGMRGGSSEVECEVFHAQWLAIRAATQDALDASRAASAASGAPSGGVDLGKLVPLVDVSGSMSGTPMEAAIALGILVSELTHPAFANRLLTFESSPQWVKLEAGASVAEKVRVTAAAPWGGNTDFAAAMDRILEVCVAARLGPGEIPDLIVFSDMQFDQADGSFRETHHERIVRKFAEAGAAVCGAPWPAPGITFWNLRGDTHGFPAAAAAPGVRLLSGFSPALLKLLLAGEPIDGVEVDADTAGGDASGAKRSKVSPLATLRKALDDARYDPVRCLLARSGEGALAGYSFTPAEAATAETAPAEAAAAEAAAAEVAAAEVAPAEPAGPEGVASGDLGGGVGDWEFVGSVVP